MTTPESQLKSGPDSFLDESGSADDCGANAFDAEHRALSSPKGAGAGCAGTNTDATAAIVVPPGQTQAPSAEGFGTWLRTNFKNLDQNGDGKLAFFKELIPAIVDPKLASGGDNNGSYLSTLRREQNAIKELTGGGSLTQESMDRIDAVLKNSGAILKENAEQLALQPLAEEIILYDKDGDAKLSRDELAAALKRTDLTDAQKSRLGLAEKHFEKLAVAGDQEAGTISVDDVERFPSREAKFVAAVNADLERSARRLDESRKLPDNRIAQGETGSCFFLASLITNLQADPKFLDNIVKDNGDGTSTVTFPGADKPITVNNPTDAEIALYSNAPKVAVAEKAAGVYLGQKQVKEGKTLEPEDAVLPQEIMFGGGNVADALALLTGKPVPLVRFADMTAQQKSDMLKALSADGTLAVAGSQSFFTKYDDTNLGIMPGHAYAIKYDPARDRFILDNPNLAFPRGMEPTKPDGTAQDGKLDGHFELSSEQFFQYFELAAYTTRVKKD